MTPRGAVRRQEYKFIEKTKLVYSFGLVFPFDLRVP